MDLERLFEAARLARSHSYSPHSRFAVGAAVLTREGSIFTGTNIENRSFGLTLCAERVALGAAVSAGAREFAALVVLADADPPVAPCGACREAMAEFCGPELPVYLVNLGGDHRLFLLGDLLPQRFELPRPVQAVASARVEEVFASPSNSGFTRRGSNPVR